MSTSDEERSLSGGSSVSGRSYGSVPAADISLGVDEPPESGGGDTAMTPITAEDERHARHAPSSTGSHSTAGRGTASRRSPHVC